MVGWMGGWWFFGYYRVSPNFLIMLELVLWLMLGLGCDNMHWKYQHKSWSKHQCFLWSCLKNHKIWFGFTSEPWFNFRGLDCTFPKFAKAICVLLRLYSKCWGYMNIFAEVIYCIMWEYRLSQSSWSLTRTEHKL